MQQNIQTIRKGFQEELKIATHTQDIESLKVRYLGRKGPIQQLMRGLKDVSPEQRPVVGKTINELKEEITQQILSRQTSLTDQEEAERLKKEKIDISLPGRCRFSGNKHVVTQVLDQMIDILCEMGFSVQYGPDIDTDYYNFEALNFPKDHPARDMQDTFYITPDVLLRTHTSNIQTRVLEKTPPPIRIIAPGKVYRNETITYRSHVFFHQVEALYIDRHVTFADLLATLEEFIRKLFDSNIEIRYRPSYFPFVEPGMEVDIRTLSKQGEITSDWLEVAGAGLVHPEVLKNGNIDPEIYSGYAWGIGIERIAMLKFGIKDIRRFTENNLRFLSQFPSMS